MNDQFAEMRQTLSELDLMFSQQKKQLKFDIELLDERDQLEKIDEKIDIVEDDGEVDDLDDMIEELRPGRAQPSPAAMGTSTYGASNVDTEFIKRF